MNQIPEPADFRGEDPPDVRIRKARERMGEDAFVASLIEKLDGQEIYSALMCVPHYSTEARDRLLAAIAQSRHTDAICLTYAHYKDPPAKARLALIDAIIATGDSKGAFCMLCEKRALGLSHRKRLVEIAAKDSFYAGCTHDWSPHVTDNQRRILKDAHARTH